MTVSTPGASIPIGVYRGRGCGISAIGVYEDFIGREVQNVVDFMAEQPTSWAQFENGNLTSTADVSVWQNVLGQRQLVLGVPACCGASAGSGGTTWADEASGVNDAHWEALGNRLIGLGLGGALLRIGREFNGNWYPGKSPKTPRRPTSPGTAMSLPCCADCPARPSSSAGTLPSVSAI